MTSSRAPGSILEAPGLDFAGFGDHFFHFLIEPPPGGSTAAHPPLAVWPFVIEFLFGGFFAFLGVLGFLGILAKNLEKIIPQPSQIEFRGPQNQGRGVQNPARRPPRRHS